LYRSHPRQASAAARTASVARGGIESAAQPVAFTVLLGFIVLLSIFTETVVSDDGASGGIDVGFFRRGSIGRVALSGFMVQCFNERCMGFLAVLSFGVRLLALLLSVTLSHETTSLFGMLPAAEPPRRDSDTVAGKGEPVAASLRGRRERTSPIPFRFDA
jgi:hypothetical protein